MAERIRARAIRRCGELLARVEKASGKTAHKGKLSDGLSFGRVDAAKQAGLSERQRKQSLAVARVPEPE